MSHWCQSLSTGFPDGQLMTKLHVPVLWGCEECGQLTWVCRFCIQPLARDRYGRWFALKPRRAFATWVDGIAWYKERGFLWRSRWA